MDENTLIEECRNGEPEAYRQLYDRYAQPLLRTAARMLGNRHDAEDAVQTAFVRLFRSISRFEGRSALSSYLFRILINVCYDMSKKKKRMRMETADTLPDAESHDPTARMSLEYAINGLPPRMKACFTLFAVEEMKQEDIAEILGLSVGGVKSNIYHAKRRLRALLEDEGGPES